MVCATRVSFTPKGEFMTALLNESTGNVSRVPKFVVTSILIVLMVIGAYFSFELLKWTLAKRVDYFKPAQENSITMEVRERQLACLARNIYYEAGNEPFEGKVAVAQVTLNRADSGQFPADICRVVYQKNIFYEKTICQFSWYCDRAATVRPLSKEVYDESMVVAKKVLLEGFRLPSLTEAMYYHADYVNPGWRKEKIAKIGRHIFYR